MGDEGLVLQVNQYLFREVVLRSEGPFALALVASWCPASRTFLAVLPHIAARETGKVRVGQTDVDEDPDLARSLHINVVPTVSLYQGGELVDSLFGARTEEAVLRWIDEHCNGGAHDKS